LTACVPLDLNLSSAAQSREGKQRLKTKFEVIFVETSASQGVDAAYQLLSLLVGESKQDER